MKKLNLNASVFHTGEVLSRSQLKKVLGGYGGGYAGACVAAINCGTDEKRVDLDCGCSSGGTCSSDDTSVTCNCTGQTEVKKSCPSS